MSEQGPVKELISRVKATAGTGKTAAVVCALLGELERARAGSEADPERWGAWADGADVPGAAFEELLPGVERRAAGQFLTPFWAADLMADWILERPVQTLCDPAVGSGRLLFRALRQPDRRPQRLVGLDVDSACVAMADLNLRLRGSAEHRLLRRNFLLDEVDERPDGLICNPPYSRHHAISANEKEAIHSGFEQRLGLRLSRLAGLHVLFLMRALEIAAPGARIAFITPAEWLDVNYGRAIKRFVLDHAYLDALVILKDDHLLFDGALTTAAISLLRKASDDQPPIGHRTKILHLPSRLPETAGVLAALGAGCTGFSVDEVVLGDKLKWSRKPPTVRRGRPLGLLARVRRGVATGCNRFFVISEAARREHDLPMDVLRPSITTPRLVPGLEFDMAFLEALDDTAPRWIIECKAATAEASESQIGRYLRWGRDSLGAHSGYLASKRKPWYALEQRGESPILFTYMNRRQPRFIRNRAGAVPLNTFLIVEPIEGVDAEGLWHALNSPAFLEQLQESRRAYGGGLWKIEPKELESLVIEDRLLSAAQLSLV